MLAILQNSNNLGIQKMVPGLQVRWLAKETGFKVKSEIREDFRGFMTKMPNNVRYGRVEGQESALGQSP